MAAVFIICVHTYNFVVMCAVVSFSGVVWSSPLSLLKSIDHGDVFGTGANHQVSQQHLDQRYEDFKNVHKHHWPYMPQEDTANTHM